MFPPTKLAECLTHRSLHVARFAQQYFSRAHDPFPLTPTIIWNAIHVLGPKEGRGLLPLLGRVKHESQDLQKLFQALRSRDESFLHGVFEASIGLDPHGLQLLLDAPTARALPPPWRSRVESRVTLSTLGFEELWQSLLDEILRQSSADEINSNRANDILWALSHHAKQGSAQCEKVFADPELYQSPIHLFALHLAGTIRNEEAIPHLLDILGRNDSFMSDLAVNALIRIGTPNVVEELASRYPTGNDAYRVFAPAVLDGIKRPESEAASLKLLREIKELEDRSRLALTLFSLCTTDGFEDLHRIVATHDYVEMSSDFETEMFVLCTIQNRKVPELEVWRTRALERSAQAKPRVQPKGSWRSTSKKNKRKKRGK